MPLFRFLFFFCICTNCCLYAQQDSVVKEHNDTIKKERKLLKSIKKILFKRDKVVQAPKKDSIKRVSEYLPYQGKKIRNIYIQSNDPFGYSISDSTKGPENRLERLGNALHGKTKERIINNFILFKEGDKFDSIKIKESERLLRETSAIRRAKVSAVNVDDGAEVDLYVRTVDAWTMVVTGSASTSRVGIRFRERNFLGVGHMFDNRVRYDFSEGKYRYSGRYYIQNIMKSFVSFDGYYYKDFLDYFTKSVSLQRRFYSPLTRWAGGVSFSENYFKENLDFSEIVDKEKHSFHYNNQDFWGGVAFRIRSKNERYGKINNLILSARYNVRTYSDAPDQDYDPDDFFSSHRLLLGGIGFTSRSFLKEKYVFRVGMDEDIPLGRSIMFSVGNEHKNDKNRAYFGMRYTSGNKYKFGYLGANIEYGTYFNKGNLEQSVFKLQSTYFTDLFHFGDWRYRQFISSVFVYGYNRFDTQGDMISLHNNDYLGMSGFNSQNLFGTQKAILSLQSQVYSPWSILGFRMSPYLNATFGMLGNENKFVLKNKVYPSLSLGVVLSNDFLVFNIIQLSFTYFPSTPGKPDHRMLFNTFQNNDFGQLNYEIGRPETVKWNKWY